MLYLPIFKKAFNIINHSVLIKILKVSDFEIVPKSGFNSYLRG